MFGFNLPELLFFSLIVLLLFGSRIPGTLRSLGVGIREFRHGMQENEETASA